MPKAADLIFAGPVVWRLTLEGKKETKSNANENMRTYLLRMKKGVSSVNEKMTKKLQ